MRRALMFTVTVLATISSTAGVLKDYGADGRISQRYGNENAPRGKGSNQPRPPSQAAQPGHAVDSRTGKVYPGAAGGVVNPQNGDFYPRVPGGYVDPKTGRFIPGN